MNNATGWIWNTNPLIERSQQEMDQANAPVASGSRNLVHPDDPQRRITTSRFEMVPSTANAATSALDPESPELPEQFKCPICLEVPLGEVVQCPNGHPICKQCQEKSGTLSCAQCRECMIPSGNWIRNRVLEQILDLHMFKCPFWKNGCQEVLSRGDVRRHKRDCSFDDSSVCICKYFNASGQGCQYKTRIMKPEEALEHLETHHLGDSHIHVLDLNQRQKAFYLQDNLFMAVALRENGVILLVLFWIDNVEDGCMSVACLQMNKLPPGQAEPAVLELTLESKSATAADWKLGVPVVSVLKAPMVLEKKPLTVSTALIRNHLLKDARPALQKVLRVKFNVLYL